MKLIALIAIAAALIGVQVPPTAAAEYKIGVVAPTTGPAATVGVRQLASVRWWEGDVNAKGGIKGIKGNQVRLIHCNDEANPEHAVTCVRNLLSQSVTLIINCSVTGATRATMPLVDRGPVMLTPAPGIVPSPDGFVFQTSPSDVELTEVLANYLSDNHIDRLGMIAATDASSEAAAARANEVFPGHGIALDLARIDLRATDASAQLARVAGPDTEVIFSSYSGGAAAAVVKSYSNLGLSQPFIVSYANISSLFVSLIRNDMPRRLLGVGVRATVPAPLRDPAERRRTAAFTESYQALTHERVDQLNLMALGLADTTEAILRNVDDPTDAKAVRAFLETTPIKSFQTIRFSPKRHVGMGIDDLAILELKDGQWEKAGSIP
jgi:branched-chain amino acid transport system substrate-binding protein